MNKDKEKDYFLALLRQSGLVAGPMCRDCADVGPTCPDSYNLPCDPAEARKVLAAYFDIQVGAIQSLDATIEENRKLKSALQGVRNMVRYRDHRCTECHGDEFIGHEAGCPWAKVEQVLGPKVKKSRRI